MRLLTSTGSSAIRNHGRKSLTHSTATVESTRNASESGATDSKAPDTRSVVTGRRDGSCVTGLTSIKPLLRRSWQAIFIKKYGKCLGIYETRTSLKL